ncbi:hypothetical protein [Bacteroides sp.]
MEQSQKITVFSVLQDGVGLGVKNIASLIGAIILWMLTIWIPYLNVGTTIAMNTIPVALSRGKVISPTFIFDGKYRKYMGEYFTLQGLMSLAIFPALVFMLVPGIIISIGWSLSLFILLDKEVAPGEAMIRSNKATYGYKWTIFGVGFMLGLAAIIAMIIFSYIPFIGLLLIVLLLIAVPAIYLGCMAVIYKKLVLDGPAIEPTEAQSSPADVE